MRRNHGKSPHLILLGVVNVAGCDSLWSPFLAERGGCQTDPATCSTSSDTVGADAGTVFDMMESEVRPKLVRVAKGSFTMGSPATEAGRNSADGEVGGNDSHTMLCCFYLPMLESSQKPLRR